MTPEPVPPDDDGTGRPTNRKATYSLLFGIAAFACVSVFTFGGFALGIPAITTGIHARREIALSRGAEGGDNIAGIGLIVGGAAIVVAIITFGIDALPSR
ncbi:DUF4190 domain-containing protein [Aeromicrobium sp.]|uniref:DUF4190 domain-containing protein n=1 Tax=Aeromicrobium sp. TaxID=1871063 RepID=UPI0019C90694|nr:DUF4190 domain-containing protein [Aeromicrobium sp.]MBC7631004.1 DUF4190 domain-containing protein [Aeromicrobium sp.]